MSTTFRNVIEDARAVLQDADKAYWSDAELVAAFNEGRELLYSLRPRLYQTTATMSLVAGPDQTLPGGSNKLFDVLANESHEDKREITVIDGDMLARTRPRWRGEDETDEVLHYIYREMSPTVFEVYPPAEAGTQVSISYAAPPTAKTTAHLADSHATHPLTAERELGHALTDYVAFKAFKKLADTSPAAAGQAAEYFAAFNAKVGAETSGRMGTSPNTRAKGSATPDAHGQ